MAFSKAALSLINANLQENTPEDKLNLEGNRLGRIAGVKPFRPPKAHGWVTVYDIRLVVVFAAFN